MFTKFRLAMAWVHTWFGLVLGFVLIVCFFFGSLSVFDREIDRWSNPASRFAPQPMPSFENVMRPALAAMQPLPDEIAAARARLDTPVPDHFDRIDYWAAYTTHRDPVLDLYAGYSIPDAEDPHEVIDTARTIDPRDGRGFANDRMKIGSGFFYPLHYSLTIEWYLLGYWIVGLAALTMLVALVSGVVIHARLFREFFTFRPDRAALRSVLDLHNLTGVVALPFHFFFAFTGLVIFAYIYFPIGETQLLPLHEQHEAHEAAESGLPHERAGVAAPIGDVDAMMADAQRRWRARGMAGDVGYLELRHVGDANGTVSVYRAGTDRIALVGEGVHYQASTGELLHEDPPLTAVGATREFLTGLHLQHFRHWPLRFLYLLGGLSGAACIATGFLFFVEKRRRRHAGEGRVGARIVDALAVAAITGMPIAALAILVANRLLPDVLPMDWPARDDLERWAFWGAWALAALHAAWLSGAATTARRSPAWRQQCLIIAALALAAVVLNAVTTADPLWSTLARGYWPVAGVDLALIVVAMIAAAVARRLGVRAAISVDDGQAAHA